MGKLAINGGCKVVPIGLIKPWPQVTDADRQAVMAALDEAVPWRYPFPSTRALEHAWAQFVGTKYALACNSGTAALHMCVAAAGVGPGDEVLVPADTFLATASCVLHSNGLPIFVDVDARTYNIDPQKIEEQITDRTKAIIAVDLHGLPADYEQIYEVASNYNLVVIEDGAQATGATYQGRQVGALGDMAGCSMNGSKCLSALGEGGLFSTGNDKYFELAQRTRMFGELVEAGETRQYDAYIMGWNYRHDPLQSAFAHSQLKRLPAMTEVRIRNGAYLTEQLQQIPGVRPPYVPPDRTHTYFFYPILVEPEEAGLDIPVEQFREGLKEVLAAEGVPARPWQTRPVPAQSLFQFRDGYGKGCPWTCPFADRDVKYDPDEYPVATDVTRRRLVLGHCIDAFGPPNDLQLMEKYAEAFHKVLVEHRGELIDYVHTKSPETRATMGEMPRIDYSGS